MYRQGHYAKLKKPTGPELYEDAARILDELLQKQLNDQLKSHGRAPRYKTHPLSTRRPVTSGEVLDERDEVGLEDGIGERCKTMPSRMRGSSKDEPLLPKDLDDLIKRATDQKKRHAGGDSSSADTEGDSLSVLENRKKKNPFQRAKERLLRSFRWQEKVKENRLKKDKEEGGPGASPKKQSRKTLRKKEDQEAANGVKDKGGNSRAGDSRESVLSTQNEGYGKRRNSSGKTLLNSIRKSFKSKKEDRRFNGLNDDGSSGRRPSPASSEASRPSPEQEYEKSGSHHPPPAPPVPPPATDKTYRGSRPHRHPPPPTPSPSDQTYTDTLPPLAGIRRDPYNVSAPSGKSLTVPGAADPHRKGSSQSHSAHEHSVSPYPHSSSTDSHLGEGGANGNQSSSVHSYLSDRVNRGGGSVLDDPGDDIEYMDTTEDGRMGGIVNQGGSCVDRTVGEGGGGSGRDFQMEGAGSNVDKSRRPYKQQSSLCVDGDSDKEDGKHNRLIPENADDVPLHERTAEEKEEMYGKIAQKLIHIADTFAVESGLSDAEGHHKEPAAAAAAPLSLGPEGDGILNDLEKQILECLRDVGDRNSQVIDIQAEELMQQTKAQTYERFKSTVQQSLGNDLSWDHLALLFYTTKGVVSAVGMGSKVASEAKEMTLRYFSDKFAKWLMDQGGFDSVLSESDSELD